jgi:predicted metal-dependent hydrolase
MIDALPIETRTTGRTRRLRVTVYPGGRIVLSRPRWVSERGAARFLRAHYDWILRQSERMRSVVVPETRMRGTRRDYVVRKEAARALINERLSHFAPRYGFTVGRVAIKNMTSRWGSCSAKGNLNFHYKVVDLPQELVDYLVVHELCHLKEMNHGEGFWELVGREVPHYGTLRKRLRAEF